MNVIFDMDGLMFDTENKAIDPNGNLVFEGLFTKKDEFFSGSEAIQPNSHRNLFIVSNKKVDYIKPMENYRCSYCN